MPLDKSPARSAITSANSSAVLNGVAIGAKAFEVLHGIVGSISIYVMYLKYLWVIGVPAAFTFLDWRSAFIPFSVGILAASIFPPGSAATLLGTESPLLGWRVFENSTARLARCFGGSGFATKFLVCLALAFVGTVFGARLAYWWNNERTTTLVTYYLVTTVGFVPCVITRSAAEPERILSVFRNCYIGSALNASGGSSHAPR